VPGASFQVFFQYAQAGERDEKAGERDEKEMKD
jgi:hypothetical protein